MGLVSRVRLGDVQSVTGPWPAVEPKPGLQARLYSTLNSAFEDIKGADNSGGDPGTPRNYQGCRQPRKGPQTPRTRLQIFQPLARRHVCSKKVSGVDVFSLCSEHPSM